MQSEEWNEIILPFANLNGFIDAVWELILDFNLHLLSHAGIKIHLRK